MKQFTWIQEKVTARGGKQGETVTARLRGWRASRADAVMKVNLTRTGIDVELLIFPIAGVIILAISTILGLLAPVVQRPLST